MARDLLKDARRLVTMCCPASSSFAQDMLNCIPSLNARARCLCRNGADAQDLVQETLARALTHCDQFELGTNLRAWMHQILFHQFVSRRRRNIREQATLTRFAVESKLRLVQDDSIPSPRSISPRLEAALRDLPQKIADVVRKVDIEEASYREVADELNIPIGTVMSRLFRGRRRLAESISDAMQPTPAQAA